MNVPKLRFKQFKDEWNDFSLKNNFEYFSTNSLSREQLCNFGKIKNIHYGDIHKKYGAITLSDDILTYVKDQEYNNKYTICRNGDLILADASEDYEGIGKSTEVLGIINNNVISGLHTIHARDLSDSFVLGFKGYYFNSPIIHNQIRVLANGFKVFGISKDTINKLKINIPSKNEQVKIVETLQLLDKKIELQSQKIEALKLYKKGLENYYFNNLGECEKVKLGDICNITTGKLDANAMVKNGKYRFYTCASEYYFINNYAFDTEALLISGNGANVGYIHYYNGKFNAYQRTYVLDSFIKNIQYVKIYLEKYLPIHISLEKRNGNTPYITLSTVENIIIKIPRERIIKKFINQIILFTNKIELEENKLLYLNELKKGLMQKMFV